MSYGIKIFVLGQTFSEKVCPIKFILARTKNSEKFLKIYPRIYQRDNFIWREQEDSRIDTNGELFYAVVLEGKR